MPFLHNWGATCLGYWNILIFCYKPWLFAKEQMRYSLQMHIPFPFFCTLGPSPNEENNLNLQNEKRFTISLLHVHTFESTGNTSVNISMKEAKDKNLIRRCNTCNFYTIYIVLYFHIYEWNLYLNMSYREVAQIHLHEFYILNHVHAQHWAEPRFWLDTRRVFIYGKAIHIDKNDVCQWELWAVLARSKCLAQVWG